MAPKGMQTPTFDRVPAQRGFALNKMCYSFNQGESSVPSAARAIDYFVYQIVKCAGAYTAVLGGLDAFVFTVGIGENDPALRAAVVEKLAWLGAKLDHDANRNNGSRISTKDGTVSVCVIPTDEERMIAQHTAALASLHGE
jgi:acetate kinase